jgi:predicted amidohydrolase YtcJ
VKAFSEQLLQWGVTALQDATASNSAADWDLFQELQETGLLRQRVALMMGALPDERLSAPRLRLGPIKVMLNESAGRLHPSLLDLNERVLEAHRAGWQVALHVVTRDALGAALNALEYAQASFARPDARHRIEHCSVCTPEQAARIAALGAHVCTQPGFLHYSGDRYLREVPPEDAPFLYPLRSLQESDVSLSGGSDSPVAPADPIAALQAAVTRRSAGGAVVTPEQRIDTESAIEMYTRGSAAAVFQEHELGLVAPGYLADLVLLPAGSLAAGDLRPVLTVVGGEIAWEGRH